MMFTLKNIQILSLVLLLIGVSACQTETKTPPEATPTTETSTVDSAAPKPSTHISRLIVEVDKLRLRAAGEAGAEVIEHLPKGTVLTDLNEISIASQTITIRGVKYTEPWLKVRTTEGKEGWVFGGAVNYDGLSTTNAALKMRARKLTGLFGKELSQAILAYGVQYREVHSDQAMAKLYQEGSQLRDSLVNYLTNRIVYTDEKSSPDLFWLDKMLPGFTVQLVAEGTAYYFFWNYKTLATKANTTKGGQDDDFMALSLKVHRTDSIEHFFPSWFLQTWDYGGNSLLGQGVHQALLTEMDKIYRADGYFAKDIIAVKTSLMDDITNAEVAYWESQDKILAELDAIIAADLKILSPEDKIALATRRKQFAAYKKNKIKLNVRAGMS